MGYSITPILHCSMLLRRVSPGECGFTSSDGDPGTNGATSKTRCGREMNTSVRTLQAPIFTLDNGRDYKEAHARRSAGAIPLFLYERLRGKIMSAQGLETIEATVHKIIADRFIDPLR